MQDKRQHHRIPFDQAVVCKTTDGSLHHCTAQDLSLGGMFVKSDWKPQFNENLVVTALLPGQSRDLDFPAVVRWVRADGFGVQFGLLGAKQTHAITRLSLIP